MLESMDLGPGVHGWLAGARTLQFTLGGLAFTQYRCGDGGDLYAIRNHPSVRTFMPDPTPLDLARHLSWADANLLGGNTLLFIGRRNQQAVGFLIVKDLSVAGEIEVGVMFVDAYQKGMLPALAGVAAAYLALEYFGAQILVTYANERHEQALRLNRGIGLLPAPSDKPQELCFRTPTPVMRTLPLYVRRGSALCASLRVLPESA